MSVYTGLISNRISNPVRGWVIIATRVVQNTLGLGATQHFNLPGYNSGNQKYPENLEYSSRSFGYPGIFSDAE